MQVSDLARSSECVLRASCLSGNQAKYWPSLSSSSGLLINRLQIKHTPHAWYLSFVLHSRSLGDREFLLEIPAKNMCIHTVRYQHNSATGCIQIKCIKYYYFSVACRTQPHGRNASWKLLFVSNVIECKEP